MYLFYFCYLLHYQNLSNKHKIINDLWIIIFWIYCFIRCIFDSSINILSTHVSPPRFLLRNRTLWQAPGRFFHSKRKLKANARVESKLDDDNKYWNDIRIYSDAHTLVIFKFLLSNLPIISCIQNLYRHDDSFLCPLYQSILF